MADAGPEGRPLDATVDTLFPLQEFLGAVNNAQIERVRDIVAQNVTQLRIHHAAPRHLEIAELLHTQSVECIKEGAQLALMNRKKDMVRFFLIEQQYVMPYEMRRSMLRSTLHDVNDVPLFSILIRGYVTLHNSTLLIPMTLLDVLLPTHDLLVGNTPYLDQIDNLFGRQKRLEAFRTLQTSSIPLRSIDSDFDRYVDNGQLDLIQRQTLSGLKTVTLEYLSTVCNKNQIAVLQPLLHAFFKTQSLENDLGRNGQGETPTMVRKWRRVLAQMIDKNVSVSLVYVAVMSILSASRNTVTLTSLFDEYLTSRVLENRNVSYLYLFATAGVTFKYDHLTFLIEEHGETLRYYLPHLRILMAMGNVSMTPELFELAFLNGGTGTVMFMMEFIGDGSQAAEIAFFASDEFAFHVLTSEDGYRMVEHLYQEEYITRDALLAIRRMAQTQLVNLGNTNLTRFVDRILFEETQMPAVGGDIDFRDLMAQNEMEIAANEFWNPVARPITRPDEIMELHLQFFESFCTVAATATTEQITKFRRTMLECSDILQLTAADRAILRRRHDPGLLCAWMTQKQKERLFNVAEGSHDVITQTDCSDIPLLFLVVLGGHCFEIISLWTHLRNDERRLNPASQEPFTEDEIRMIDTRYDATYRVFQSLSEMVYSSL